MSINLKARFKPRAEAGLLSRLVQEAWQDYQDQIANKDRQAEVAKTIARYFEGQIPPADFEVLERWGCVSWHERCNVRVYDAETEDVAKFREQFGVELPRKVPVVGAGGFGYPSLSAIASPGREVPLPELDGYFLELLKMRKQYQREYKESVVWPVEQGKAQGGKYPTWGEIAERFPVLGEWLRRQEAERRQEREEEGEQGQAVQP
jgi:hypothetical protein